MCHTSLAYCPLVFALLNKKSWMCNGIGVMNIAFVNDDIADTFGLNSFTKGLVGSAVFVGKRTARRM